MFYSSSKVFLLLCAVVQSTLCQCTGRTAISTTGLATPYAYSGPGLAYEGLVAPTIYPAVASTLEFTPTSGGALPVTSASAIPPTGISVVSENVYEGALAVAGELPFVGAAAVEGEVPSAGAGAINHACGDGVTERVSETTAFVPESIVAPAAAITPVASVVAPAVNTFGPTTPLSANRFAPNSGLGLGNRFGPRGCGHRGLMY